MSAVKIIQAYAKKSLTKNQGSGITTLPSQFMAESKAGEIAAILQQAGMPLQQLDNFIRSEADLLKYLNIIKNAKPVSTTEKASGTILPFKQKRSFAEEIEAMKKSGDIVDVDDIKISEKITDREMFKNSNLNKPTVEGQMEKITGASNRIKEIQKEQADMYRPKTDAEIKAKFERQNKEAAERLRNKMKDEPEDKADGGRIGFRAGKFVLDKVIANLLGNKKKVQQAVDDIFPTGDYKYDADMAADALVENNPQIFKNLLREDLSDEVSSEIYGAVLKPIMSNMAKMRELRKATKPEKTLASMKEGKGIDMSNPEIADEFGRFMKETDPEGYKKLEQTVELSNFDPKKVKGNAEGGRIGYYTGGITDVEPSLDDIGHGSDSLMSRTRLMSPGSQTTTSTGLNYLLAEDNDNLRVPFNEGKTYKQKLEEEIKKRLKYKRQGMEFDKPLGPEGTFNTGNPPKVYQLAEGGRIGFKGGGLTSEDYLKVKDMLNHWHDYKKGGGTMSKTNFGIAFFRENNAEGGRIGFSGGGDPRRRAFLKLMATLGGGIAGIKTGLLGLGEGAGKKAVTETVKQSAGGTYPPPYFFKLVEKIKFMGDDVTEKAATQEREIVKRYKDYEMTEDIGTGNIVIKKRNEGSFYDQDGIISDEYIVYKPGQADELTKGKKPPPEYDEYTVRPDSDGKLKDSEDGLDSIDEILEEVGDPDSMTLKKANGGRIGYVGGGLSKLGITGSSRKFLEKVFGKQKFQNLIENDPEMHRGLLEVAEMFRSKDKSGLVEYMQNFLPQMSKKELEAFVVGSGDTAGIEGQLIRLGSGRDYKNKIEMIEEANNIRKLKDFDIDGVSKNAEGGRIGFSGGGIIKAIIAKAAANAGKTPYEFIKKTGYKSLPPKIKMFMSKSDYEKLKFGQEEMYSNYVDMAKTRLDFQKQIEGGKTTPARELFENAEKIMDEQSYVPKNVTEKDIAEMELMIKNRFQKGRKDNAEGGLQTMLGE